MLADMKAESQLVTTVVIVLALMPSSAMAQSRRDIDVRKSILTVRVYKSGMFSAFAHDHEIRAAIQSGAFDEQKRSVEFKVNSRELKVLDPDGSDNERAQVQQSMLGPKVLDSGHFPEISFRSTSVEANGSGKWNVQGELTLHGQTRPVKLEVEDVNGHYRGSTRLKQTEFGITPISIGGGTVKVKDDVRVEFEIFGK
jgi:polyisoprenoid-binding protein YceI